MGVPPLPLFSAANFYGAAVAGYGQQATTLYTPQSCVPTAPGAFRPVDLKALQQANGLKNASNAPNVKVTAIGKPSDPIANRSGSGYNATSPSPNPASKPAAATQRRSSKVTKARSSKAAAKAKPRGGNLSQLEIGSFPKKFDITPQLDQLRQTVSSTNWAEASKPPSPPSCEELLRPNGCIGWQIQMARHLACRGVEGPYEIGDYLCNIQMNNGEIIKLAARTWTPDSGYIWESMLNAQPIEPTGELPLKGKPLGGPNGSYLGFEDCAGIMNPPLRVTSPTRMGKSFTAADKDLSQLALLPGCDPMWN